MLIRLMSERARRVSVVLLIAGVAVGVSVGAYEWHARAHTAAAAYQTSEEEDVFVRFDMELFDIIQREYWQTANDADLAELYRLSLEKVRGSAELLAPDRVGTSAMLAKAFDAVLESERKQLAVDIGIVVLANLAPQGRSGLLSEQQEQDFRDTVNNIDREKDLYAALEVESGASVGVVEKAFEEKKVALEKEATPEAAEQLKEVTYARDVLTDTVTKAVYDEAKIEPSLVSRVMGSTLYVDLAQVTPATFNEFINVLQKTADQPLFTSLVLDLRGNLGGTLDFSKYLLALFVGPNQYAFDLLRKGELVVERTPAIARIDSLQNFEEVVILTDEMTQSTAELTTVIFKKRNMATVVGVQTRGWGTVEDTYPMETVIDEQERYRVLLVNSLMLREDNEPIETRGVDPDIDTTEAGWKQRLHEEFRSTSLVRALEELMAP